MLRRVLTNSHIRDWPPAHRGHCRPLLWTLFPTPDIQAAISHIPHSTCFHCRGIAHRDLKLENLLLQSPSDITKVKIADFGLAKKARENAMDTICGTPQYVAPEVIQVNYLTIWAPFSLLLPGLGSHGKSLMSSVCQDCWGLFSGPSAAKVQKSWDKSCSQLRKHSSLDMRRAKPEATQSP